MISADVSYVSTDVEIELEYNSKNRIFQQQKSEKHST